MRFRGASAIAVASVAALMGARGAGNPAVAQTDRTESLSLADLDALESEGSGVFQIPADQIWDAVPLMVFFAFAVFGFLRKSPALKYVTLAIAIVYLGFMKANLVSMVHVFRAMDGSFPIFRYSVSWYVLIGFTLVSTVLWGRFYCGRICAFGALTQLMDRVLPRRWRIDVPKHWDRRIVNVKFAVLAAVSGYFLVTGNSYVYKYVEPFWMFTLNGTAVMWVMLAVLLAATVFVRNFYCRYLCSVGALLGIVSHLSAFRIKRWSLCKTCKICENACEWGAIAGPKISVRECVRCDDCEIIYSDKKRCAHLLLETRDERRKKKSVLGTAQSS